MNRIDRESQRLQAVRSQDFHISRLGDHNIVAPCVAICGQKHSSKIALDFVTLNHLELQTPDMLNAQRLKASS